MINKQNLWFVTLFSLILILGIYYVSIDDEVKEVLKTEEIRNTPSVIEVTNSDVLVSLEVEKEEEKHSMLEEYQDILLSKDTSVKEKNDAYEKIQNMTDNTKEEENIKTKLKEKFKLNSFVKIKDNSISVVIASNDHDTEKANQIIRAVQELYTEEKYITVKYQK